MTQKAVAKSRVFGYNDIQENVLSLEVKDLGMVIAVLSGKGGTGKTSVCAGLATALAGQGQKILCIDLDVGLRNLDIALGMSGEPVLSFTDVSEGDAVLEDAASHPRLPGLYLLTAPIGQQPEELDRAAFRQMIQQARRRFDYVLLDAPAGVGAGFRMAAENASIQILVTGPDPGALRDGARFGEILELMGKEDVRLVVNRVEPKLYTSMGLTVDDVMDLVGYRLLGLVPEDHRVVLAAAGEKALLEYTTRGAAAALQRIALRLMGHSVPIQKLK